MNFLQMRRILCKLEFILLTKLQFKEYSIKDFFIVLSVILISKSLYYESYGTNILLIGFLSFLMLNTNFKYLKINKMILLYIFGIITLLLINIDTNYSSFLVLINRVLIAILVIYLITFERFSKAFIDIIIVLSVISWFSWLVILLDIPSFLPNFAGIDGRPIRNFIFFGVWEEFINYKTFRNSGLWWEPGAFQVFVNLAFIFSLINKVVTIKKYFVFLITIISITSTTGFLVFLMLSLIYFKKFLNLNKKNLLYLGLFLILSLVSFVYLIPLIYDKFNSDSNSFVSFLSRYYDVLISINMFVDNIFIGYGFGSQIEKAIPYGENLIGYDLYYLATPTGADGITMFISQVGILGFILIIPFLFPKYISHLSVLDKIVISISLFLIFNTENFTFLLIFIVLTFYGLIKNKISLQKEKYETPNNSQ